MSSDKIKESVTLSGALGHINTVVVVNDGFHLRTNDPFEIHSHAASHKGEKNNADFHVDGVL